MSTPVLPPSPDSGAGEHIVARASAGARLLTIRGVAMRVVSLGTNVALFALVAPADLGLLAVVRGLTALAGNTTDLGFAWALLRRREAPTREEYGTLAGIQLTLVLLILAVALAAPSLLTTVGSIAPEWHWWMLAVLATTLVVPFGTSAKVRIEREMNYRRIAFYDLSSILFYNVALLTFAALGKFTLGVFVTTGAFVLYGNLLLWFWSPGPGPRFVPAEWRRLGREFAGFSTGHLCYLLYTSATPILVANLFGLSVAGIWAFAVRLGNVLQAAFEGFRRAAVPAAAHLSHALTSMRRLVEDTLVGAARLTIPAAAALFALLPAVHLLWPKWSAAAPVGQVYVLGFALAGLASASLVPAAVALRGPSVVIAEQAAPMVVGWLGFVALRLAGQQQIAWVILPMHLALVLAVWFVTDRSVRPTWNPELRRLAAALAVAVVLTVGGQLLALAPLPVAAAAGAAFVAIWGLPAMRAWLRVSSASAHGERAA